MQYDIIHDNVLIYDIVEHRGIKVKDIHCYCSIEDLKDFVDEFNRLAKEIINETQNKDTNI